MKLQPQSFLIRPQDFRRHNKNVADNQLDEGSCPGNVPAEPEEDIAMDFVIHDDGFGPVVFQIKGGRDSVQAHAPGPCACG